MVSNREIRTAIFVDAANMHGTEFRLGWKIDYEKALAYFSKGKRLWGAYYFTPTPSADNIGAIKRYRAFKNVLIDIGYSVIDKEVKVIEDPQTGEKIKKANLDIEFALHVLTSMDAWDEAIFFTGDSDFACLMWHLRTHGKEVVAVSARGSVSTEVRNAANRFVDLHRLRRSLERKKGS